MGHKPHPEMMRVFEENFENVLACWEAAIARFEQLAKTHAVLEIEPGGAELWHVPQVRAMHPWTQENGQEE